MTRQEAIKQATRHVVAARRKLRERAEEVAVIRARRDDPYWARSWYDQYPYAKELVHDAATELAKAYCLFYDATVEDLDADLEEKLEASMEMVKAQRRVA